MAGMKNAKKEDDWWKDYQFERRFLRFYYLDGNTKGDYIDAVIGLHIPISELKVDIATAKEIAKKEGFGAEVTINFYNGEKYLDIYDNLYLSILIQTAIQNLKEVARKILKEERAPERAPERADIIGDKMAENEKYKNVKKFETEVYYIDDSEGYTIREEGISEVSPTILLGGVGEFYHTAREGTAAIGLRIPIDKVNGDIDSAIAKAKDAGLDYTKVMNYGGYKYLEISKQGYDATDDENVVVELKNVAIAISKEDYSNHIKGLPLELKTFVLVKEERIM